MNYTQKMFHRQFIKPASFDYYLSLSCRLLLIFFLIVLPAIARVEIKPGFNLFKPDQDIQLGKEAVQEIEKELPVVKDAQLNDYITRLGNKLTQFAPGHKYPYRFGMVAAEEINAFALPGGPIFIHTGIVLEAKNEAEVAGVLAHEISHVALRHSTNQASKAMLAQAPLAILGGVLSGGGLAGQLAQMGIGFGAQSAFLKFSRDAERQADQMGAQILYDAGYDPKAMAEFFETLEKKMGKSSSEFFSSHPNPGNRRNDIANLLSTLGPAKNFATDSQEFQQMKRRAADFKDSKKITPGKPAPQSSIPDAPSKSTRTFIQDGLRLNYPDNWIIYGQDTSVVSFVPQGGLVPVGRDATPAIAYGSLVSVFEPVAERGRRPNLESATNQLIRQLQQSNPGLNITGKSLRRRGLGGQETLFVAARGSSPIEGQSEINWIFTTMRPDGLFYIVFIAPERQWNSYELYFQQIYQSVRFAN